MDAQQLIVLLERLHEEHNKTQKTACSYETEIQALEDEIEYFVEQSVKLDDVKRKLNNDTVLIASKAKVLKILALEASLTDDTEKANDDATKLDARITEETKLSEQLESLQQAFSASVEQQKNQARCRGDTITRLMAEVATGQKKIADLQELETRKHEQIIHNRKEVQNTRASLKQLQAEVGEWDDLLDELTKKQTKLNAERESLETTVDVEDMDYSNEIEELERTTARTKV